MLAYLIGAAILIILSILQTNVIGAIEIAGATPDIVLIFMVYIANKNGPMVGQVAGFVSGVTQDILSVAPLGFYALTRTMIGMIFGLTRGNVYLDAIVAPILLTLVATIMKGVIFALTGAIFGVSGVASSVWSLRFLTEILYNAALAPLLFGLFGRIRSLEIDWRARNY